jgi:hypothetical protein
MADPEPLRAIFRHTIRFYDALSEQAKVEEGLQVYRGHPTTVTTDELDLPLPYYSKMREILIAIGCVKQIKRGSGKTESVWVLVRQPTETDFEGVGPANNKPNTEFRLYQLATDAAIARLEARLGGLDVVKAVLELNAKLDALQAVIDGQKTQKEN